MYARAHALTDQLVSWRRDFHKYPELGFQETRTAAKVAEIMKEMNYRLRTNVGKTGVVADLGEGSPTVAIRADMDALPIYEANEVSYASQNKGVMHACGHDAHMTAALGAATLLSRDAFPGKIRFIFQPAEETTDDDGICGAQRMIEDGVMEGVDAVLALHVDASMPVGDICADDGPCSAGVDTFYASVIGQGGHGAYPHRVIDPIHLSGHVILAMNAIVSRRLHPMEPAVVSIGSIHGGEANNVIPDQVDFTGTIRYMSPNVQTQIHIELEHALQIARVMGGDYDLEIEIGYPPMYNHDGLSALIRQLSAEMLGQEHILTTEMEMGAEDFGFYATYAPGSMFLLGARLEGDERKHHHPHFDIDERCLPVGAAVLANAAQHLLCNGTGCLQE